MLLCAAQPAKHQRHPKISMEMAWHMMMTSRQKTESRTQKQRKIEIQTAVFFSHESKLVHIDKLGLGLDGSIGGSHR